MKALIDLGALNNEIGVYDRARSKGHPGADVKADLLRWVRDELCEPRPTPCRWVPVSERLPERIGMYWCIFRGGRKGEGRLDAWRDLLNKTLSFLWSDHGVPTEEITHWLDGVPPVPEKGGGK